MAARRVEVGEVDLYIAGPPCQSFSRAGFQAGEADSRGCLFQAAVDYVVRARPEIALLENVADALRFDAGQMVGRFVDQLEGAGFL
eukprot:3091334-Alexandrium_andersonii.AAC.1